MRLRPKKIRFFICENAGSCRMRYNAGIIWVGCHDRAQPGIAALAALFATISWLSWLDQMTRLTPFRTQLPGKASIRFWTMTLSDFGSQRFLSRQSQAISPLQV